MRGSGAGIVHQRDQVVAAQGRSIVTEASRQLSERGEPLAHRSFSRLELGETGRRRGGGARRDGRLQASEDRARLGELPLPEVRDRSRLLTRYIDLQSPARVR